MISSALPSSGTTAPVEKIGMGTRSTPLTGIVGTGVSSSEKSGVPGAFPGTAATAGFTATAAALCGGTAGAFSTFTTTSRESPAPSGAGSPPDEDALTPSADKAGSTAGGTADGAAADEGFADDGAAVGTFTAD